MRLARHRVTAGEAGISIPIGTRGDPHDDVLVETRWGLLGKEQMNHRRWADPLEVQSGISGGV